MRRVVRVRAFKSDRSDGLFKKNTRLLPSRFDGNRKPASSNDYARRYGPVARRYVFCEAKESRRLAFRRTFFGTRRANFSQIWKLKCKHSFAVCCSHLESEIQLASGQLRTL